MHKMSEFGEGESFSLNASHECKVTDEVLQRISHNTITVSLYSLPKPLPAGVEPAEAAAPAKGKAPPKGAPSKAAEEPVKVASFVIDLKPLLVDLQQTKIVKTFKANGPLEEDSAFVAEGEDQLPAGMLSLTLAVTLSESLLTPLQSERLNPCLLTVVTAENMPKMPTSYAWLRANCLPVSLDMTFFGDDEPQKAPRILNQAKKLPFAFNRCIFTGLFDQEALISYLERDKLQLRIFDRNRKPSPEEEQAQQEEEAVKAGQVDTQEDGQQARKKEVIDDPYGVATVSLKDVVVTSAKKLSLTAPILPAKLNRRELSDKGAQNLPGQYVESDSYIKLKVIFARRPGSAQTLDRKFERMILRFAYDNTDVVEELNKAVETLNAAALGVNHAISATLATLRLTSEQAADSSLDIVTGFHLVDGSHRCVVLEGLATGSIATLKDQFTQNKPRAGVDILYHKDYLFTRRLYLPFQVAIKRIRLKKTLSELQQMLEMYIMSQVPPECFDGIIMLNALKRASLFAQVCKNQSFPSTTDLLVLEKWFGDALRKEDYAGVARKVEGEQAYQPPPLETTVTWETDKADEFKEAIATRVDHTNPGYMEFLSDRPPPEDFIQKNRNAFAGTLRKKEADPAPEHDYVFNYSSQKLNYSEWQKNFLREKYAGEKDKHFTFSGDYLSLAFSTVDPVAEEKKELQMTRSKFMTERGFQYPAPKHPSEYNCHPKAPSQARQEELQEPWIENSLKPKPIERGQAHDETLHAKDFHLFSSKMETFEPNADFFKSVHIAGASLAKQQAEDVEDHIQKWKESVVVDDVKFHTYLQSQFRTQPGQLDKNTGCLVDEPNKKILQKLAVKPPIQSLRMLEPYKANEGADACMRTEEKDRFVAGEFNRFANKEKEGIAMLKETRRKIEPLTMQEKKTIYQQAQG